MINTAYQSYFNIGYNYPTNTPYSSVRTNVPTNSVEKVAGPNKITPAECSTCKSRKYVDGSNESNVSFKAPGHISPSASKAVVSSHEAEHVANAVREGSKGNNQFISASVRLSNSTCPECGTSYVSGGVTTTQIKYNESNPYDKGRKTIDSSYLAGQNMDAYC